MRFAVQRLTEIHLSAASIAASRVLSLAIGSARVPQSALAHRWRSASHAILHQHPPSL